MQLFTDGPARRVAWKLRHARRTAQQLATRTTCAGCNRRRLCAPITAPPALQAHYCLADCWPYQQGVAHGHQAAAYTLRALIQREVDRVFDPGALEVQGWPWYRCDLCGQLAPEFTAAYQLERLGWQHIGRDAHLCPTCTATAHRKPLQIAA